MSSPLLMSRSGSLIVWKSARNVITTNVITIKFETKHKSGDVITDIDTAVEFALKFALNEGAADCHGQNTTFIASVYTAPSSKENNPKKEGGEESPLLSRALCRHKYACHLSINAKKQQTQCSVCPAATHEPQHSGTQHR